MFILTGVKKNNIQNPNKYISLQQHVLLIFPSDILLQK